MGSRGTMLHRAAFEWEPQPRKRWVPLCLTMREEKAEGCNQSEVPEVIFFPVVTGLTHLVKPFIRAGDCAMNISQKGSVVVIMGHLRWPHIDTAPPFGVEGWLAPILLSSWVAIGAVVRRVLVLINLGRRGGGLNALRRRRIDPLLTNHLAGGPADLRTPKPALATTAAAIMPHIGIGSRQHWGTRHRLRASG